MDASVPVAGPAARAPREAATLTAGLREEHETILRAVAVLERLGRRLERGEAVEPGALPWLVEFFRTFLDRCHHGKEEQHLFPALERRGVPRDGGPIGVMLEEHDEGRSLVRAIAEGVERRDERGIAEVIRRFVPLLRAHIDKENGVLFPMAEEVLPAEEQRALAAGFEVVEAAVAGPAVRDRLEAGLTRLEGDVR